MTLPPGILAAAVLFWGWQSGAPGVAVPVAVLVELPRWLPFRYAFRPADLARIADLSTVLFVALVLLLAVNRGLADGVLGGFGWLPVVLAPLVAVQGLSRAERIPLSALFRHLRQLRRQDPSLADPGVDLRGPYLALCVVSAGAANPRGAAYYWGAVALAAAALYAVRPRHVSRTGWALAFVLAAAAGYGGQAGLVRLQEGMERWFIDWHLRGLDTDPYRNLTDMGTIGRLKARDTIVLRVYAEPAVAARARRLHRASYTSYSRGTWLAPGAPLLPLPPTADGAVWLPAAPRPAEPPAPGDGARIVTRLDRGKALLALPPGNRWLRIPADAALQANSLGAVQVEAGGSWLQYVVDAGPEVTAYAPPTDADLRLPAAERALLEALAARLGGETSDTASAVAAAQAPPVAEQSSGETAAARSSRPGGETPDRASAGAPVPVRPAADRDAPAAPSPMEGAASRAAVASVEAYFAGFGYSTYRARAVPGDTSLLADFLLHTRQGHCEYFAAATTLLLRAAGVPARYATGFALMEYSPLEEAYVVRARHAHAWTRAWVDGQWIDVDTTPAVWFAAEAELAPAWQPLLDLVRWASFRWASRGELPVGWLAYGALAVLAGVLAWRLARGRRVGTLRAPPAAEPAILRLGGDSEFHRLASRLAEQGLPRGIGESLHAWGERVLVELDAAARAPFRRALALHRRYRFDPQGLSAAERQDLREAVARLLESPPFAPRSPSGPTPPDPAHAPEIGPPRPPPPTP